jgi:hypothetical protein
MSGRGALFTSARRLLANTFGIASWLAVASAEAAKTMAN